MHPSIPICFIWVHVVGIDILQAFVADAELLLQLDIYAVKEPALGNLLKELLSETRQDTHAYESLDGYIVLRQYIHIIVGVENMFLEVLPVLEITTAQLAMIV